MGSAGYVLAGGRSRRMGQDKALMLHHGAPLALRVAGEVYAAAGSVALVGDPKLYKGLNLPVVPDLREGCGPLAGLEAALASTTGDWNLVVACDLPEVDRGFLTVLLAEAARLGADAVVPRHPDGFVEPLCAVYHRRVLPLVRQALDAKRFKMHDMVGSLSVSWWPVSDPGVFRNVNTPEEWRSFQGVQS